MKVHLARAFANWYHDELNDVRTLRCSPKGRCRAIVYPNGTWHTWDKDGVGGENDTEKTVSEAMRQAYASCVIQGFI
ncbi:hypothetical protein KAR91_57485 [Candidatus Pacearchaeota archaeon]|nr:hypothetical protein [Candidatus Pacearchaeota archaeon]